MNLHNEEKILNEALILAKNKIDAGKEPPWSWYQYMKLIETTEAILNSIKSVKVHRELSIVDE